MYRFLKRILDLLIALISLLILSPLLILVSIILRFTGEKEIFYLQERMGYRNETFQIWKFATMVKNSPNLGTGHVTTKNDARVLPFGKFLRKSKINELPQIVNVLKGEMSIVGARPVMKESFLDYSDEVKKVVYATPPGITGVGSIIFRDEESLLEKTDLPPKEFYKTMISPYKGLVEIWYQQNKSLLLDLQIIFLTAWVIIFPKSKLHLKWFKQLPQRPF